MENSFSDSATSSLEKFLNLIEFHKINSILGAIEY